MSIARFLSELRHPELKCDRIGHNIRVEMREGHAWPSHQPRYYVADWVTQERMACTRCPFAEPWKTIKRKGLTGYSMPASMEEKLRTEGFA